MFVQSEPQSHCQGKGYSWPWKAQSLAGHGKPNPWASLAMNSVICHDDRLIRESATEILMCSKLPWSTMVHRHNFFHSTAAPLPWGCQQHIHPLPVVLPPHKMQAVRLAAASRYQGGS